MSRRNIIRTPKVEDLLRFLKLTPAPASEILKASQTFGNSEEPGTFQDLHRVREKMTALKEAGYISIERYAVSGRAPMNFYHLTRDGYRFIEERDPPESFRRFFQRASEAAKEHMFDLCRIITHIVVSAHRSGAEILWAMPENTFVIEAGQAQTKPDFSLVLQHSGMRFNTFFERDRHTEPIDSAAPSSIRNKILTYEAYYDLLNARWRAGEIQSTARPRLRVPFITNTMERAMHILYSASQLARNPKRLLVYATTMGSFLNERDALREPVFLDHDGNFQALVNLHPTSAFLRDPVRLTPQALAPATVF